ncbi:hypothetical protein E2C01_036852 [Portunus trituberculatus]|uniref:Uncharacterized protein n=1 Tax=Portunus trituberculatus TaxID=210409 RepID=A0A5B7FDK8_PORTR|nr:hypothetical protein [Portunus trituberculatus]
MEVHDVLDRGPDAPLVQPLASGGGGGRGGGGAPVNSLVSAANSRLNIVLEIPSPPKVKGNYACGWLGGSWSVGRVAGNKLDYKLSAMIIAFPSFCASRPRHLRGRRGDGGRWPALRGLFSGSPTQPYHNLDSLCQQTTGSFRPCVLQTVRGCVGMGGEC